MKLATFMAKACEYAQEHIDSWDGEDREQLLQCTSYQMACFFAQNTRKGKNGVECDIILEELIERPMKTEKEWENILNDIADELGGWK